MNFKQFKKELFKDKEFKEYYDKEEQKEKVIKKIKSLPRYTFLTDKKEFTKQDVISREEVIKILNQEKLL